jgi:hypothetical protein
MASELLSVGRKWGSLERQKGKDCINVHKDHSYALISGKPDVSFLVSLSDCV